MKFKHISLYLLVYCNVFLGLKWVCNVYDLSYSVSQMCLLPLECLNEM